MNLPMIDEIRQGERHRQLKAPPRRNYKVALLTIDYQYNRRSPCCIFSVLSSVTTFIICKLPDAISVEESNGNDKEHFSIWSLRIMAGLQGIELTEWFLGIEDEPRWEDANSHVLYSEKIRMERAIIVTDFGDKLLRDNQNGNNPKDMWEELSTGYKAASTAKRIVALSWKIITCLHSGKDMRHYIVETETFFSYLATMGLIVGEGLQVAIQLEPVMKEEYTKCTAAVLKNVDGKIPMRQCLFTFSRAI